MVRTRADAGSTKVAGAKAPRKVFSSPSGGACSSSFASPSGKGTSKYARGNSYNPQPTPNWQKGINTFFKEQPKPEEGEGSSSGKTSTEESENRIQESENGSHSEENGAGASEGSSGRCSPMPVEQEESASFKNNGIISDDE